MYLQQFKFEIVYRPGKENKNADALSRIIETYCIFTGDEIQEGEGSTVENKNSQNALDFINLTPQDFEEENYEGDSEDNIAESYTVLPKTEKEISQMMDDIRRDMNELDQLRINREERQKQTELSNKRCLEISYKLIHPEKKARLNLIENYSDDETSDNRTSGSNMNNIMKEVEQNGHEYTYGPGYFGRLDEWNNEMVPEDSLPTERKEPVQNDNGW